MLRHFLNATINWQSHCFVLFSFIIGRFSHAEQCGVNSITWKLVTLMGVFQQIWGFCPVQACAVEFLILEGDNLANLFPGMQQRLEGYSISTNTFFSFITALFVLPTVWLRDLRYLSYVSGSQSSNLTYNANCRSLNYSGFMNGTGPVICYKSIQNQIKPNAMPPRLTFWGIRLSFIFWRFLHYNCFVVPGLEAYHLKSSCSNFNLGCGWVQLEDASHQL